MSTPDDLSDLFVFRDDPERHIWTGAELCDAIAAAITAQLGALNDERDRPRMSPWFQQHGDPT